MIILETKHQKNKKRITEIKIKMFLILGIEQAIKLAVSNVCLMK